MWISGNTSTKVTPGVNRILTSKTEWRKWWWRGEQLLPLSEMQKFPTFFSQPPVTQGSWISWDMRSSSAAYKRSDSASFHSLSIPFKVSLDLLFTDSHLHRQGASRDLNQVLCGPVQANIFTCVRLGRLNYCIPWVFTVFVRRPAERQQHVCL